MTRIELELEQKKCLAFARKYPSEWHSYDQDSKTRKIVKSLADSGLLEVNQFGQFRYNMPGIPAICTKAQLVITTDTK